MPAAAQQNCVTVLTIDVRSLSTVLLLPGTELGIYGPTTFRRCMRVAQGLPGTGFATGTDHSVVTVPHAMQRLSTLRDLPARVAVMQYHLQVLPPERIQVLSCPSASSNLSIVRASQLSN